MDVNTLGDLSGNGRTLTSGNGAVLPYNASDPILGGQPSLSVDGGAAYSLGFNSVNTTMFANGSDVVCIFIGYKSTAGVSYYGEIAQFGTLGGTVDVYLLNYNVIGGSTYIATDELTNNYYVSGIDLTVANEAIMLTSGTEVYVEQQEGELCRVYVTHNPDSNTVTFDYRDGWVKIEDLN